MRMILFFVAIAFSASLHSQTFTPSIRWLGDVRVRSEVDMRDFDWGTAANTYTLLRSRLGLEAVPLENVRVLIQARDSRVFGQERDVAGTFNTLADSRNMDLHQAFIEIRKFILDELTFRLGRQELAYGNERIIGSVGWHNVGRVFDGGLLRFDNSSATLDVLAMNIGEVQAYAPAATPQSVNYTPDRGQDFYGVYLKVKSLTDRVLDIYALHQWYREVDAFGNSELSRYTLGSLFKGKSDRFAYEAEVAYQGGKRRGANVNAFMLTGLLGFEFPDRFLRRVSAGYELLSGTGAGDAYYRSFDPFFHTGHKFYGFMDYFINIPGHTGDRGLKDLFIRLTCAASEELSVNIWLHNFALQKSSDGGRALGQELDVVVQHRYNTVVSFELGVSAFIPAEGMRRRFNGSDVALWGYLTTTASF